MTILADIGCLHVGWVLAECISAVVTTYTVGRDVAVIKISCRNPGGSDVAIIASVARRYVRRMFADCHDSVMT